MERTKKPSSQSFTHLLCYLLILLVLQAKLNKLRPLGPAYFCGGALVEGDQFILYCVGALEHRGFPHWRAMLNNLIQNCNVSGHRNSATNTG